MVAELSILSITKKKKKSKKKKIVPLKRPVMSPLLVVQQVIVWGF